MTAHADVDLRDPLLSVHDISVSYGPINALRGVSLDLQPGKVYGLVGPNGAGKSTLMKVIAGLVKPQTGELVISGNDVHLGEQHAALDNGIRLVPQETSLIEGMSIVDNINLGAELRRGPLLNGRAMRKRARAALAKIGLDRSLDAVVGSLPISEQRLVMVAKALRDDDLRLLILDEPTAAMSVTEAGAVLRAIDRLRVAGITTVLVTHRFDEVVGICDQVVAVRDGEVVMDWHEGSIPTVGELIAMINGGRVEAVSLPAETVRHSAAAGPLLCARRISGTELDEIDFELSTGEVVGVLGRPGSGAEQFLGILAGVQHTPGASFEVGDWKGALKSPATALQVGIGYLPSDRKLASLTDMSVGDNLVLSSLNSIATGRFLVSRRRERALQIKYVPPNLRRRLDSRLAELSGGNRQRVLVARLVAAGAKVLLLNNPTAGVDVAAREMFREEVLRLAAESRGIVLYSTEPEELVGLASRVLVFVGGQLQETIFGSDINASRLLSAGMLDTPSLAT